MTTDGHGSYPRAIRSVLSKDGRHRTGAHSNNRLEQDHRVIKGRIRCMRGSESRRLRHNQIVSASLRRVHFARATCVALSIMHKA